MAGTEPQTDQDYNQPAEHSHSHVQRRIHQSGYPPHFSFIFNGTTHIHLPPANGSFVMPTHAATPQDLRTTVGGVQTPAAGQGSSRAGCHQQIGPAPFLDVPEPEYLMDWRYPQPSGGLYNGGLTSGARMDAVRPGSVTGGYNPGGPGANLTPGVQTPTVGFGPAGSSGVGNNQLTPNATLGFGGQTSQAQFLPEYDTQAAAPPAVDLGLNDGGFTSGAQMNAIWSGAVTGGYNPWEPGASLTPSVQIPAVGLGQAAAPPAVGFGLNNGGFTSGAQMNAVWSGAVTGGYNPGEPGASLTPSVQIPAVGLGQAAAPPAVGFGLNNGGFTSGAQMNAVWPGVVTGGYNPGEPGASLTPGVQTLALGVGQAAAPPEDCLPSSCSDSFMDQIFRV
ncbi:hypothetical protein LWI29_012030 [Acer saccharum]|uniref:Uncharacterized protein n=1 Tax=Acer saccharum TaxID=4024 RepID=A0AA39SNC5_ACESA|nr:hypothetical protein LWI29_012030 [Acer saccharum]